MMIIPGREPICGPDMSIGVSDLFIKGNRGIGFGLSFAKKYKADNPGKKVLLPDLKAGCSLSDSAPPELFKKFKEKAALKAMHPSQGRRRLCEDIVHSCSILCV
jgi:hypothetical protein